MSKPSTQPKPATPMTRQAASRIQSVQAKRQGGQVKASDFAARAQSASAFNSEGNGNQ